MSQSRDILDHLKDGGSLTPADAYKMFGCLSLSQRMGGLRRDPDLGKDYEFHSELVEVIGVNGKKKHVARYWITPRMEAPQQMEMELEN